MFTGLIREMATVVNFANNILTLKADYVPKIGDSIAIQAFIPIKTPPMINPGMIPPKNKAAIEVSDTSAYKTSGIDGGIIGPIVAVAAVIAAAYPGLYRPLFTIIPIINFPIPAASATAEPDIPEKMRLATTLT